MSIAKGKINFIVGLVGLVSCIFFKGEIQGTLLKISIGLLSASIIDLIVYLYENRRRWNLILPTIINRNVSVRVTVAYLFRIELNGKYLLIKRHKTDFVGYQPIGGAYKYFKDENRDLFQNLGILPCNYVPRDSTTDNDLRVIVSYRKNLIKFFKWFDSRRNREIDPWREFYEELIESGLLPLQFFKHIEYAYLGCHQEGILKSRDYPIDQFRHADIYDLRINNDNQKDALLSLNNNEDIAFVTAEEIRRGATEQGIRILPHTFKILPK